MSVLVSDPQGVLATCPSCGARNRQRYANLNRRIRCGRCKADLPPPSEPVEAPDAAAFDALIAAAPVPVLVDFWAPWCGPCRMVEPTVEKLAREHAGKVRFAKVNVDENPVVAQRYGVQSIPTMMVVKNGQIIDRWAGALPEGPMRSRLAPHLG